MRLTKDAKKKIIRDVIADMQFPDFNKMEKDLLLKAVIRQMPADAKKLYSIPTNRIHLAIDSFTSPLSDIAPWWNRRHDHDDKAHHKVFSGGSSISFPVGRTTFSLKKLTAREVKSFDKLRKQIMDQSAKVRQAESDLTAVVNSCNTLARLKEALPRLEKYYPKPPEPVKQVPAPIGLLDDLKDAGLPLKDAV